MFRSAQTLRQFSLVSIVIALPACSTLAAKRGADDSAYSPTTASPSIMHDSLSRESTSDSPVAGKIARGAPSTERKVLQQSPVMLEPQSNTEKYTDYGVNPFVQASADKLSTFAIDVDTASYSIARRKINGRGLPPKESVRTEEFINSFDYGYTSPSQAPIGVELAAAPSPYASGHTLVRVGVQAKRLSIAERKPVHLVYLVDTSGSMMSRDKLELAKESLKILTNNLKEGDTVALSTYAGSVREVLPPTGAHQKDKITSAIDALTAGGSTAMESGIELAYKLASRGKVAGHVNHVVILSDGDANVGRTSHEDLLKTISKYKDEGITLSTVGFGEGNYKDTTMEQLADKGDGNYSYIDSREQARRVFGRDVNGLLETVAKDVKIQVEFKPESVKEYRLIGYENRDVADKDFRNDKVDGGEIGAGHSVTALYDVVFRNEASTAPSSPITVHVRYKPIGSKTGTEFARSLSRSDISESFEKAPRNMRFATSVSMFSELLRQSPFIGETNISKIRTIALSSTNESADQQEFIELLGKAEALVPTRSNVAALAK